MTEFSYHWSKILVDPIEKNMAGLSKFLMCLAISGVMLLWGCQTDNQVALENAILEGEVGKVQLLIDEQDVDVTQLMPEQQRYPLEVAAEKGESEIIALLLKAGADPDKSTVDLPPILLALNSSDQGKGALHLIEAGADIKVRDKDGFSPMDLALLYQMKQVVEALLKQGSDPEKGGFYATPLHGAAETGNVELIQTLLNAGAYVDARDEFQESPLFYAIRANIIPSMETLVQFDADVNLPNDIGETPIFEAVYYADSIGFEWLIEAGADIKHQDDGGDTPLHRAAAEGSLTLARILLANGAELKKKNLEGMTAEDVATAEGRIEVAEFLANQ